MKNLTVIIPIYNIKDETDENLFKKAISSVDDSKIIVVGPESDIDKVNKIEGIEKKFKTLVNTTDNVSYPHQVNIAVNEIKTDYFSVLEYDDFYTSIWFNNLTTYIDSMTEDVFAYLPLIEVLDNDSNQIIGFANEAVWASSFSEELGYFDLQCLEDYLGFNTSGGVFKTQDFKKLGMLKSSMELSYWYEFLLRALYKGKRIFVIPKTGYIHRVGRKDSISYNYKETMDEREGNWWIDLAKKEYFFPQDRNKKYTQE